MRIVCPSASRNRRRPENGIALVIVMISIFVLTILAAGFAFSMKVETKLAQHANNETELQWLGRSGVEYARWVLFQQGNCQLEPWDSLNQAWATGFPGGRCATNGGLSEIQSEVRLGNGSFTWKMTDYERKWNINGANEMVLQQALILMVVDPGEMTPIVNSILDWMDPDDNPRIQGTETSYYQGLDPPYEAKNGPIDDLSELLLIKNFSPELYWGNTSSNHPQPRFGQDRAFGFAPTPATQAYDVGFAELFTSLGGTPAGKPININTASAAVLQLIPGVDSRAAEAIVAARGGEDDGTGLTGPFASTDPNYIFTRVPLLTLPLARIVSQFTDKQSRTFQVEVKAKVAGSERTYYATLVRNNPRDIQVVNFFWKW